MDTFDPSHCFGFLTNRISRLINQQMEDCLRIRGYTFPVSCVGIMADLWEKDGVNQKDLGSSLVKTKSSINKMLSELENAGLIVKQDDPDDRRNKLIFLTKEGHALKDVIKEEDRCIDQMSTQHLTEKEILQTKRNLKIMYQTFLEVETKQKSHTKVNPIYYE